MDADTEWPDDQGPESLRTPPPAPAGGGDTSAGRVTPPPDGGQPPAPGPASDGSPAPGADPQARYDALTARFTTLEGQHRQTAEENARLRDAVALVLGRKVQPAGEPPDPRLPKIREALLQAMPELAQLDAVLKTTGQRQKEEQVANDRFAAKSIERTLTHCATQMLGAGKTAKDLSPRQTKWLKENYIDWVFDDEKRMERYNDSDPTLQNDFWKDYHSEMRANAARAPFAQIENRGTRVDRLPNAGPSAAPVASPAPPVNIADPDEVHRRAAARVFGEQRSA